MKNSLTISPTKKYREEHCYFKKLNNNGKCIASCHWNIPYSTKDCIGREGITMDIEAGREECSHLFKLGKL
jgi:hypothetical protein